MADLEAKRAAAQSVLDWLQEHFPHKREVRLVFVKPVMLARRHKAETLADLVWGKSFEWMRIASNHPNWALPDTLMHEWAHVVVGRKSPKGEWHPDEWALAYGRIYRKWYGS